MTQVKLTTKKNYVTALEELEAELQNDDTITPEFRELVRSIRRTENVNNQLNRLLRAPKKQLITDIPVGYLFKHPTKGIGEIIRTSPRILVAKFKKSRVKITYNYKDEYFNPSDF